MSTRSDSRRSSVNQVGCLADKCIETLSRPFSLASVQRYLLETVYAWSQKWTMSTARLATSCPSVDQT